MKKYIVFSLLLLGGIIFLCTTIPFNNRKWLDFNDNPPIPELYPEIEWQVPQTTRIYGKDLDSTVTTYTSTPLLSYPYGFISYYQQNLESTGWELALQESCANGEGESYTYWLTKNRKWQLLFYLFTMKPPEGYSLKFDICSSHETIVQEYQASVQIVPYRSDR